MIAVKADHKDMVDGYEFFFVIFPNVIYPLWLELCDLPMSSRDTGAIT